MQEVHALLDNDLVDELRLLVFPVSIGVGHRVFPDTLRNTPWTPVESRAFPSGIRLDVYRPARAT